jgi:hypothetical protein
VWVAAWPEYGGRGGDVQGSLANGGAWAARRGWCASITWHRPGDPHASCKGTRTRRSTHRAQACLGVRVRRGTVVGRPAVLDVARAGWGVPARSSVNISA